MYILSQALTFLALLWSVWASESALLPFVYDPIPLGSIKPLGWMKDQLQLMADGLAGHEHEFYRYVADSTWIGGTEEYSSLNEAWPYWLNAIVPLAYGLDNEELKTVVRDSIDYIFENQQDDGWIGPEKTPQTRFFWPRTLVLMGITQYLEAEPNEVPRLLPLLYKYMELSRTMLADDLMGYIGRNDSAFDYHWGITRSHDMLLSLQWFYDYHPEGNEQLLLDIMNYFNGAAWDWAYFYSEEVFPKQDLELDPPADEDLFWFYHGVNSAMGLKAGAIVRRLTHNTSLMDITRRGNAWTFEYHGSPSGSIIGDEPWVGLSPTRGSELCTTVEAMYSLGYLYRAFGDRGYADQAELTAFNALPAAVSPDWWSHQYVTQINQPFSYNLTDTPFENVNSMGQTFGLEPDYPCCTVNHPQGYPKFLSASYVKFGKSGIAHSALIPSVLTTTLESGTNDVTITCKTIYPFGSTLNYTITATKTFDFYFRVPKWAIVADSYIQINNEAKLPLSPDPASGLHEISISAGTASLTYTLVAEIVVAPRANDTITITYGSLLYALEIGESVITSYPLDSRHQEPIPAHWTTPKAQDHQIFNTSPWNIAIDPNTLAFFSDEKLQILSNPLFTSGGPPTYMTAIGCEIAWELYRGTAAPPPLAGERECIGEFFEVKLVPYGSAKLHMAQLPTVDSRISASKSKLRLQDPDLPMPVQPC